jgi:hypothetical protein
MKIQYLFFIQFYREWNKEIKKNGKKASLARAILRIYFLKFTFLSLLMFLVVRLKHELRIISKKKSNFFNYLT